MTNFKKITENSSAHESLELMSTAALLHNINLEDQKVAAAVSAVIPQIEILVKALTERFLKGGRLFYIGAGTSGRLGILDASEIPPTFGLPHDRVIGLIAGGDSAIRKAVEFAEDNTQQAWKDLKEFDIDILDTKEKLLEYANENYNAKLYLPGEHNAFNATAALAMYSEMGNKLSEGIKFLNTFTVANSRMEIQHMKNLIQLWKKCSRNIWFS